MNKNYWQLSFNVLIGICTLYMMIHTVFFQKNIAYIDSNKIIQGYKGTASARKEYEQKVELFKERMDTLTARVKYDLMMMGKLSNDRGKYKLYSDSAEYHKRQYVEYRKAAAEQLQGDEQKLTQGAVQKLNEILKEYGKNHNYDLILIASNAGTIAYAKDSYDITKEVLDEINK